LRKKTSRVTREIPGTEGGWDSGSGSRHEPVLLQQVIEHLALRPGLSFLDGTLGGAGHFSAVAAKISPGGSAIGLDRDAAALGRAQARLAALDLPGVAIRLVHAAFSELERVVRELGFESIDRILLDLGLSSDQLDEPRRGFSFLRDGPLDMRQDTTQELTAADVVNTYPPGDLTGILRDYGEERHARRIAEAIVSARRTEDISSTQRLVEIVMRAIPGSQDSRQRGKSHPATRTFQALRMEVNDEVGELRRGLSQAAEMLSPEGRIAVITFHSLEDRELKAALKPYTRHGDQEDWYLRRVSEVIRPGRDEVVRNPRSRSARLRVYEKVAG
jgi:16S rRNA (cytosine1402-N4)-methyltransferase